MVDVKRIPEIVHGWIETDITIKKVENEHFIEKSRMPHFPERRIDARVIGDVQLLIIQRCNELTRSLPR